MHQSQSKPLARKQPDPFIVVLDAALINSEDTHLAAILADIAQKNVKIVFVGQSAEQLKEQFPNIAIETISLVNLRKNANKYSDKMTYCFMNSAVMTIQVNTALSSHGFQCTSIQLGGNLSQELQQFSEKKLPKTKAPVQRSTSLLQKQQAIGSIYDEQPISNSSNEKLTTPKSELPPFVSSQPQTPIIAQTNNPISTSSVQPERRLPPAPTRNIAMPLIVQQTQNLPPPIISTPVIYFSEQQQNTSTQGLPPFPMSQQHTIVVTTEDSQLPPSIDTTVTAQHTETRKSLVVPEQHLQNVVPQINNNSQQDQILTQVPQIPVPQQFPMIQNFSYSLCDALGRAKDKEENLPKITLSDDGNLFVKIKHNLTDGVDLSKDPFWSSETDNEIVKNVIVGYWATTSFKNVDELINNTPQSKKDMPKNCGFQFCGDYKLSLKCLKGDQSMTPQKLSRILSDKNTPAPAIIQYCGESSSFLFGKDEMSFYLYVQTSNGTPHLIKLANKNDRLTKLELESSQMSTMLVSRNKYSIIHDEVKSAAIEALYRELCVKEGLDFDDVWNKAKYHYAHNFRTSLYKDLKSGTEIEEEKESLPELGLDADGVLTIKVSKSLAEAILKDQKLVDILKSDKDGNFCAAFKNTASLKAGLLDVLGIDFDDVELEGLYRELCEKNGHDFIAVWENVRSTVSPIKPAIKSSNYNPTIFGPSANSVPSNVVQSSLPVTNNPLPVKAIVIEEDLTKKTDNNPYYEKIMVLIKQAAEKNVPVIIYCLNEDNETERFKWAKELQLPVTTAYQAGLKTSLSDLQLNPDNCLHLSMGQSKLYTHTKRKTNYFVVQSSDDFDLFLEQDYKLPINLEKVYPEIHGFICNLDFNIMNQVIANETKSNAATHLPALSLDAQGCLSIKQGDVIKKYQNIDEFSSMLNVSGFDYRQKYTLNVKLVQGDVENFTIEKVSKLVNLKMPALIKYLCTESDKLSFYYCELLDGKLEMRQLANTGDQLGKLKLEAGVLSVSNQDAIFCEIAKAKELHCVNVPKLYQELCAKEGLDFNKVWNKIQHYPEISNVCNLLSLWMKEKVAWNATGRNPIKLNLDSNGVIHIVIDDELKNKIKGDTYLENQFGQNLYAECKDNVALSNFLSYFEIKLDDDNMERLYKALCKRDGHNFDQVWKNANPNQGCTQQ